MSTIKSTEKGVKLHDDIKEMLSEGEKTSQDPYTMNFLSINSNDSSDYKSRLYKRQVLMSKLMKEQIPKGEIMKKLESEPKPKEKLSKEILKEVYREEIIQNIFNTLSPEVRSQLSKPSTNQEDLNVFTISKRDTDAKKGGMAIDNNVIFSLCHNFSQIDDYH